MLDDPDAVHAVECSGPEWQSIDPRLHEIQIRPIKVIRHHYLLRWNRCCSEILELDVVVELCTAGMELLRER